MLTEDPRIRLISNERSVYIHLPAGVEDKLDACSLPFLRHESAVLPDVIEKWGGQRILRIYQDELSDGVIPQMNKIHYELSAPLADADIKASRESLDKKVLYKPLKELENVNLTWSINHIQYLIDRIFRWTICSMERIVISFLHPEHSHLLITTTRDTAKKMITIGDIMICDISQPEDIKVFRSDEGKQVTSGIAALMAYHAENPADTLLHAHLVFPVLLDDNFRECYFTKKIPRSAAFGRELSKALKEGNKYILRKGEGTWCRGNNAQIVISHILECQEAALDACIKIVPALNI